MYVYIYKQVYNVTKSAFMIIYRCPTSMDEMFSLLYILASMNVICCFYLGHSY